MKNKRVEIAADSSHRANLTPCIGKAHYLGAEYTSTTTDRDMWPQSVTLEDEGSIATDNWHTMEYIRADLIDPTCHNIADDLGINDKDRFEFVCDDCGYGDDLYPAYYPHCGARVVSSDGV